MYNLYNLNFVQHFICFNWESQIGYLAEKCIFLFPQRGPEGQKWLFLVHRRANQGAERAWNRLPSQVQQVPAWEGMCPFSISFPPKNYWPLFGGSALCLQRIWVPTRTLKWLDSFVKFVYESIVYLPWERKWLLHILWIISLAVTSTFLLHSRSTCPPGPRASPMCTSPWTPASSCPHATLPFFFSQVPMSSVLLAVGFSVSGSRGQPQGTEMRLWGSGGREKSWVWT